MEANEIPVVAHTRPQQTVYNKRMENIKRTRRSFLSRDIMKVLKRHPNLTRKEIAIKTHAKSHSVKAVLFKLVAANKVACEKNAVNTSKTGPRKVNVYFLTNEPPKGELTNHG